MMELRKYFDLVCLLIEERGGATPLYTHTFQAFVITGWGQKMAAVHIAEAFLVSPEGELAKKFASAGTKLPLSWR